MKKVLSILVVVIFFVGMTIAQDAPKKNQKTSEKAKTECSKEKAACCKGKEGSKDAKACSAKDKKECKKDSTKCTATKK
jgi:Na+-transporting methylmalonyl-CoA/oxaloacetate decarboxylase gamma subunit